MENTELKAGDWVKIIKSGYGCGPKTVGEIFQLVDPSTVKAVYRFASRPFCIFVDDEYKCIDPEAYILADAPFIPIYNIFN